MTIKVTDKASNQSAEVKLSTAMIVYGISPRSVLKLDAGFKLENPTHMFECVERLN